MKFAFVTCVELGLSCMKEIYQQGYELDLVITLKDNKAVAKSGRVYVDEFCSENSIDLLKINHVNDDEVIEALKEHDIDWLFIIGWSQIANKNVLNAPTKGVIGIHPTLLPMGRGRASIPWAIIKNLDKTGVTLFKLDEGVDTGPIVDQVEIELNKEMTATELYQKVDNAHMELIGKNIKNLDSGNEILKIQDERKATIWEGRKPEDGEIDLNGSVYEAERLVRALTDPYPGAFYFDKKNTKRIVRKARIVDRVTGEDCLEFSDGTLELLEIE